MSTKKKRFKSILIRRVGDAETVCVSVPDFSKTSAVVLLDVDTLECHPVTFGR